jgi:AMP-polyphosphate phosphotransferase
MSGLESARRSAPLSKEAFDEALPALRSSLLEAQRKLQAAKRPLVVIVSGADGAGKSETVSRLHEWFDPRGVETHVFGEPTGEESQRPEYWRYWMALPPRGRAAVFLGSWYTEPILRRVHRNSGCAAFDRALDRIVFFERELALDGAVIVKLWLHLEKKTQKKRLAKLEKSRLTRWRVSPIDWKHFRLYDRFVRWSQRAIERTDTPLAAWRVVDASDDRARDLTVGRVLLASIEKALAGKPRAAAAKAPALSKVRGSALSRVDLERRIAEDEYETSLAELQGRLHRLARQAWECRRSNVFVFEGWDAAGKGGTIRRVTAAMDARLYRVIPIAAPTDEEKARQYLWRFWRHIPASGRVTIFDRSWYGRVLVERVEGFARDHEWKRAYEEIRDFESQLVEHGIGVTKFWVHVSKEEQLRRFEERQKTEFKKYKITDEDWRNRNQWDAYETAVDEMIGRTDGSKAPWVVVPGDDKRLARLAVLRTICDRIENSLR